MNLTRTCACSMLPGGLFTGPEGHKMVQAKAGQVEQALNTAKQMEERGMRPNTYTLNILLSACARAVPRNPFRAVAVRDMMTKQYGTSTSPVDRWPLLKRFL